VHVAGTQGAAFRNRFAADDPTQRRIVTHALRIDSSQSRLWTPSFHAPAGCAMGLTRSSISRTSADPPVRIASAGPQTASIQRIRCSRGNLTTAGRTINFPTLQDQDMVAVMTGSILGMLSSAVVRGLAVVALVVVWSVGHIGTTALSVVGVSSLVLTTTATPADAYWRRWRRGRRWRRWRRW
jgi:hypothetical protein